MALSVSFWCEFFHPKRIDWTQIENIKKMYTCGIYVCIHVEFLLGVCSSILHINQTQWNSLCKILLFLKCTLQCAGTKHRWILISLFGFFVSNGQCCSSGCIFQNIFFVIYKFEPLMSFWFGIVPNPWIHKKYGPVKFSKWYSNLIYVPQYLSSHFWSRPADNSGELNFFISF